MFDGAPFWQPGGGQGPTPRLSAGIYVLLTVVGLAAMFGAIVFSFIIAPWWTDLLVHTTRVAPLLSVLVILIVSTGWALPALVAGKLHARVSPAVHWLNVCFVVVVAMVGPIVPTIARDASHPHFDVIRNTFLVWATSSVAMPLGWLAPPLIFVAYTWRRARILENTVDPRCPPSDSKIESPPAAAATGALTVNRPADKAGRRFLVFMAIALTTPLLGRMAVTGSDAETALIEMRNTLVIGLVGEASWRGVLFGALVGLSPCIVLLLGLLCATSLRRMLLVTPLPLLLSWFVTLFGPPGIGKGSEIDAEFAVGAPAFQEAVFGGFIAGLILLPIGAMLILPIRQRRAP